MTDSQADSTAEGLSPKAGSTVIVTGATGGIGVAVAHAFAEAGSHVFAVDRDDDALQELVGRLPGGRDSHGALAVDLTDLGSHRRIVEATVDSFGQVDVLAHLAAVLRRRHRVEEVTEEDWDFQVDTNLKATFFLNRTVASEFLRLGRPGRIINFVSQAWWTGGFGGSIVYAATKGGVVSMSRGLARTYAPNGITVNTIAPGAADTSMLRDGLTEEQLQEQTDLIPLGRIATPEDIAGVVVFLASDKASYITGATINLTGGQLMY